MMNERIAILDLGTNTFHVLIAEVKDDSFRILFKQEDFIWLGEGGLGFIGEKAFQRAIDQLKKYREIIEEFKAEKVIAYGTAAIRQASNGKDFLETIQKICPMEVRAISGDEEATLIYYGVRQAVEMNEGIDLIMDIGGGSTEFIIANQEKIFWKQSFPIGGTVLKNQFQHHEPISPEEISALKKFLSGMLQPLQQAAKKNKVTRLIGAAGSFDSFANMISGHFYSRDSDPSASFTKIELSNWKRLYDLLLKSDLDQRLEIKGLLPFRAPLIVVAAVLTDFIIDEFQFSEIYQSAFSLQEGAAWEITRGERHL